MVWLNKEQKAFAAMLGRRLNKWTDEEGGGDELDEVAEFRLAQMLGMEQTDPAFQEIWEAVYDLALAYIDDEPAGPPSGEPMVSDFELEGMPFRTYSVVFRQGVKLPHGWGDLGAIGEPLTVQARTNDEAIRQAMAADPVRGAIPDILLNVSRMPAGGEVTG